MGNTTQTNFNIIDQTNQVNAFSGKIAWVEGCFPRGPVNNPKDLITNPTQFARIFGGTAQADKSALACVEMLNRGVGLRVNRILGAGNASASLNPVVFFSSINSGPLTPPDFIVINIGAETYTQAYITDNNTTLTTLVTQINNNSNLAKAYLQPLIGIATDYSVLIITPIATAIINNTGSTLTYAWTTITSVGIVDVLGNILFTLTPQSGGVDGNYLQYFIRPASNGNLNAFNLIVGNTQDNIAELYENLLITGNPTIAQSSYLKVITNTSTLVNVTYADLSGISGQVRPYNLQYSNSGGSDGDTPVEADFAGVSANHTGFFAFDPYADSYCLGILNQSDTLSGIATDGEAYARSRGDIRYYQHLDNSYTTKDALITARTGLPISKSIVYTAGGLSVMDPDTSMPINISEMGNVLANVALRANPWLSPAGPQNGNIPGALGVVNNFGSPACFTDLNLLANSQINMVINQDGSIFLQDDYTGQQTNNQEQFIGICDLLVYMARVLRPAMNFYAKQPLDIPLMSSIYYLVKPFFTNTLVGGRAISDWTWNGDQNATSLANLQINNPSDVALGKYKVQLKINAIAPLTEMTINIYLTPAGVSIV